MNAHTNLSRESALDAILSVEVANEQRPVRMAASIFTVWRVLDSGKAQPHHVGPNDSLAEIVRLFSGEVFHGHTFLVRETETISRRATLHTFRVRRGKWAGRMADGRKVYPYTADRLFSVEVEAFAPVEPWRCVPGADRVGMSNVIQHSSERLG